MAAALTIDAPPGIVRDFVRRGAVRASILALPKLVFDPTQGWTEAIELFPALVHFWDAQGREIGFWSSLAPDAVTVFAPDHRAWGDDQRKAQRFTDLK